MKRYAIGRFFKKEWRWFEAPHDVEGADMVNFFSYENVSPPGFQKRPTLTTVIDLTQPLDILWERTRKKFIREQIERGRRRGITVRKSDDFAAFYPIYLEFRSRRGLAAERFESLKENGILFLAYHEGRPIAGGVFVGDGVNIRAWVLASGRLSTNDGHLRDLIGEANRLVIWQALEWGKGHGLMLFD